MEKQNKFSEGKDRLIADVRLALNKISLDTFKPNCDIIINVIKNKFDDESFQKISKEIFRKAQLESKYSEMYSKLLKKLIAAEKALKAPKSKQILKTHTIEQCQLSFKTLDTTIDEEDSDFEEKEEIHKKKVIGTMRFIA